MATKTNYNDLHNIEGIYFLPIGKNKVPTIQKWQIPNGKHDLNKCYGVGILCGEPSGNLECIDVDEKYDLTGNLFERYKKTIHEIDDKLLLKMVVEKTPSGGHHLIYRCSSIAGNTKLANRPTTQEEKENTYNETLAAEKKKGKDEVTAKGIAEKTKGSDKVRVLFETRGSGGQFNCFPTPGYELIFGDFQSISEITSDEREILLGVARQFNEFHEEITYQKSKIDKVKGTSFDDYNQNGDVIGLLQSHGWQVVKQHGKKTIFLRPGQTTSQSSGNFDHEKNWFSVFTTSTEFDPQKAYLPYAVFAMLECNKDFSEASRRLYDMGYGERKDKKEQPSTRVIQSRVSSDDEDYSFMATGNDYNDYLQAVRDGTLKQGLTTGIPSLDEYFLFKEGNMVMTNGHDNAGKSVVVWYLALLSAMYHDWNWIILSSENVLGGVMRKLIQFYWGKPLRGQFAINEKEYQIAKNFIEDHFILIKSEEAMYNYKDIINMVKKALKKKKIHCGMIDPYNSLKVDLSGYSKLNTHEYHYEALSELKLFGQVNNFGWFINHHAVTAALRQKDSEKKYPIAPQKADTEQGGKIANKADDFLTIHRITQHPTEWMVTEIYVRKIKDTDTGGRVSPIDKPVKLEMYNWGCSFVEKFDGFAKGVDPVSSWHNKTNKVDQPTLFRSMNTENSWMPFKDDNNTEISF
jgi:hypothetical protein